jgi:hypothetical protein
MRGRKRRLSSSREGRCLDEYHAIGYGKSQCPPPLGLKRCKDVKKWSDEISRLEEWFYFDDPEPRMAPFRWMHYCPTLGNLRVFSINGWENKHENDQPMELDYLQGVGSSLPNPP